MIEKEALGGIIRLANLRARYLSANPTIALQADSDTLSAWFRFYTRVWRVPQHP